MHHPDLAQLLLRLVLGITILLHGIHKIFHGVGGIAGMLASHGLPSFLAYGVYIGEVIGPLMLILGVYSRLGALLIAGNMLVAIVLAHMGDLWSLTRQGGWAIELQAMFLVTAVALALSGPGRYRLHS